MSYGDRYLRQKKGCSGCAQSVIEDQHRRKWNFILTYKTASIKENKLLASSFGPEITPTYFTFGEEKNMDFLKLS